MKKVICFIGIVLTLCSFIFVACDERRPSNLPTESFDECEHHWIEASCTAPKTCSKCEETKGNRLEHTWTEATCEAPMTCVNCKETKGDALSHDWDSPTCTQAKTCMNCGETKGSSLGHSWKSATCTSPKVCTRCNKTSGSLLGHSWKNATCTSPKTCTRCNETSGSIGEHSWQAATCVSAAKCTVCATETGDALGHSYSNGVCTRCDINYYTTKKYSGTTVPDFGSLFSPYLKPTMEKDNKYYYSATSMLDVGASDDYMERYIDSLSAAGFEAKDTYRDSKGDLWVMFYNSRYVCVSVSVSTYMQGVNIFIS